MNRLVLTLAVLTFSAGLLLLVGCRRPSRPAAVAKAPPAPTALSNNFEATGFVDMEMEDYRRPSDGAIVRFGCSDRVSEAKALMFVRNTSAAPLVERTNVIDAGGTKTGERVVWNSHPPSEAKIEWNEGARLFVIDAPSLRDALTFENSKVWKGAGCWDARSW